MFSGICLNVELASHERFIEIILQIRLESTEKLIRFGPGLPTPNLQMGFTNVRMEYIAGVHNFSSEIGGLFEKTAEIKLEAWRRA